MKLLIYGSDPYFLIVVILLSLVGTTRGEDLNVSSPNSATEGVLLESLKSGQHKVVHETLAALDESGRLTEDILLPLLTLQNGWLDTSIAKYAVKVGGKESARRLAKLLPNLRDAERYDVVCVLRDMGPTAAVSAPALSKEAARMNTGSRASVLAVEALGSIGPAARDTIPALLDLYEKRIHPRPVIRENILKIAPEMSSYFEPVPTRKELEPALTNRVRFVNSSEETNVTISTMENWQWEPIGPKSKEYRKFYDGALSVAEEDVVSFFVDGSLYRREKEGWTADSQYEQGLLGRCRGNATAGDLHLAYASYNTLSDGIYYTCYHNGERTDKIQLLPLPSSISDSYDLAVNSDGLPHVCYVDLVNEALMYGHRNANGNWDWEKVAVIGFKTEGVHRYYPAIGVADDGTVYIVFKQYDLVEVNGQTLTDIRFRLATCSAGKWSIETISSELGYIDGSTQLEVDHTGALHLLFERGCGSNSWASFPDMRLIYGTRKKSEWSFDSVHVFAGSEGNYRLALDETGAPNILISDPRNSDEENDSRPEVGPLWIASQRDGHWSREQIQDDGIYHLSGFAISSDGVHHVAATECLENGEYVLVYGTDQTIP
ncbi:MAG: hypothetical protein PF495_01465 [Spirochaetales bacterium]|nr:hypothetical protein [Spirochaetales bacterium]